MGSSKRTPPLRLRRTLRVGVTGHRNLGDHDEVALRAAIGAVLEQLKAATDAAEEPAAEVNPYDSSAGTKFVMVSALAEGADSIVADEAIERDFELWAPLPFELDEYRSDFAAGPALEEFDRLYAQATVKIEFYGDRSPSSDSYLESGLAVLDHADIMIAVLDESDGRKHGAAGTKAVVDLALEALIPVIVVPPSGRLGTVEILTPDTREHFGVEGLTGILETILHPTGSPNGHKKKTAEYAAFLDEKPKGNLARVLLQIWGIGWDLLTRSRVPKFIPLDPQKPPPNPYLDGHYRWASHLAARYAALYRYSFATNYVLGAVAVTLVLLTIIFSDHRQLLFRAELAVILTILGIYSAGRRGRWHDRAADYRIIAELLRQARELAPPALAVANTRPPAHQQSQGNLASTWLSGHFQAIIRGATPTVGKFTEAHRKDCQEGIADGLIASQIHYHENNHLRMDGARKFFTRGSVTLFVLTILACVGHIVLEYIHFESHHLHDVLDHWLVVAAATLPAWAACLHGIESQAEFHRLADRSESMLAVLEELKPGFEPIDKAMTTKNLRARTRVVSSVMAEEAIDWRVIYPHGIPTV